MKLNFYNISFFIFSFRFEWMSDGIKQVRFPLRQYSGFIQVHLSHWLQTGRWWHPLWRYATLKKTFNVYTFCKHNWFTIRCWICLCDHAFEFFKLFFYWLIFFFYQDQTFGCGNVSSFWQPSSWIVSFFICGAPSQLRAFCLPYFYPECQ